MRIEHLAGSQNEAQESHWFTTVDDVDGGNPTPVDNVNVPLFTGFST